MSSSISYASALMIGLLGSAHCIGMCGGIMNALGFSLQNNAKKTSWPMVILLLYNAGRILSYSVAGVLVGMFGWLFQDMGSLFGLALRIFAGLMLIAMGMYITGWWQVLVYLEKLGGKVWQFLQPVGNKLIPVKSAWQAILLGIIWGWLPCGLVYSTLVFASTSASWQQSALIMLLFGIGTLPALLIAGNLSYRFRHWLQQSNVRNAVGLVLIIFGIWTAVLPLYHAMSGHDHASQQQHHEHTM